MRLLTIPMSHYCEKVRWGLELLGVEYVEEGHLQLLHYPHARWHSGGSLLPVLITPDGVLKDSTHINRTLDAADGRGLLYPDGLVDEVLAWEERFDGDLGVEGRRWIYLNAFDKADDFVRVAGYGTPKWERVVGRAMFAVLRVMVSRHLSVDEASMADGWPKLEQALAEVEDALSDGRDYLVADRFTAADLTFASLMAPLLLPQRYGIPMPQPEELGTKASEVIHAMRARPAGQYALRMIEQHRPVPQWMRS